MAPTFSPRKTSPHPHPQQPSKTPLSVALCGAAAVLTPHLGGDGRDASNESFRTAYRDQLIGSVDRSDRLTRAVARISSAKTHLITTQTLEFQWDKQPRCTHITCNLPRSFSRNREEESSCSRQSKTIKASQGMAVLARRDD